jgi:TolB protein
MSTSSTSPARIRAPFNSRPWRLTRGIDGVPRYSPDGTQIVFFREKLGLHPDSSGALFVVGADGTGLRRITPWGTAFLGQDWSSDGRWIVFQKPFGRLCLVHPDGTALHTVPVTLPGGAGAVGPSWSSDGAWIVFAVQQGDASSIYAVRADGTGLRRLTASDGTLQSSPDWRPTSG